MATNRPFYRFSGIAYNRLIIGDNPTKQITSNLHDRESYYQDDAIRLSTKDLENFKNINGKPLCVEHDTSKVVGEIHHHWIGENDGRLRIWGRIYTDTEEGKLAAQKVQNKQFSGLSVGYDARLEQDNLTGASSVFCKSFGEVSLCEEPFFDGCMITVSASKNNKKQLINKPYYKSKTENQANNNRILFEIMEEEKTAKEQVAQQPKAQPMDTSNTLVEMEKETQENLKQGDELKQQLETMQKELQRIQQERQIEQQQYKVLHDKYKEEQAGKLQELQKWYTERNMELPKPYANCTENTINDPEAGQYSDVIMAPIQECNRQLAEITAMKKEKDDLKKQLDEMNKKSNEFVAGVRANRAQLAEAVVGGPKVADPRQEDIQAQLGSAAQEDDARRRKVNVAAAKNAAQTGLVTGAKPSQLEIPFLQGCGFGPNSVRSTLSVNASSTTTQNGYPVFKIEAANTHNNMINEDTKEKNFPNSMREYFPAHFAMMSRANKNAFTVPGFTKLRHDEPMIRTYNFKQQPTI